MLTQLGSYVIHSQLVVVVVLETRISLFEHCINCRDLEIEILGQSHMIPISCHPFLHLSLFTGYIDTQFCISKQLEPCQILREQRESTINKCFNLPEIGKKVFSSSGGL